MHVGAVRGPRGILGLRRRLPVDPLTNVSQQNRDLECARPECLRKALDDPLADPLGGHVINQRLHEPCWRQ